MDARASAPLMSKRARYTPNYRTVRARNGVFRSYWSTIVEPI